MKTAPLELSEIHCDSGTQSRLNINDSVVTEYSERMAAGDKFPPIDVFFDGSEYHLADGFHRYLASHRNKDRKFQCNIHTGTATDALWFALGANKTNGARREPGDVRRAVELALSKFPSKTQQQIADHVGCSQRYVGGVQSELRAASKLIVPARRVGKDGKSRPTQYAPRQPEPEPDLPDCPDAGSEEEEKEVPPNKITSEYLFEYLNRKHLDLVGGWLPIVDAESIKGFVVEVEPTHDGEPDLNIYTSKQIQQWVADVTNELKNGEEVDFYDLVLNCKPKPINA